MKDIRLHSDSKATATCVPNAFIDNYMADANGEFVKIYLYLLRCMSYGDNFSIAGIADKFEHTEKDIFRALNYWEKLHILRLEYDNNGQLCGICLSDSDSRISSDTDSIQTASRPFADSAADTLATPNETEFTVMKQSFAQKSSDILTHAASISPTSAEYICTGSISSTSVIPDTIVDNCNHLPDTVHTASILPTSVIPARPEYTRDQLDSFQKEEDVQDLMFIAEKYLGRTLKPQDVNAILYWHDSLHFSMELIEYLIEHCVDKGHRSIRYIETVALAWAEAGIDTIEAAKTASSLHNQTYYAVMRAFGISGRNLVQFETDYIDTWTKKYGFTMDIIGEACKRTIQATHQPNFEYANKILTSWHEKQVTQPEDIAVLDQAFLKTKTSNVKSASAKSITKTVVKNRFTSYPQRSYDYTALEKQLATE